MAGTRKHLAPLNSAGGDEPSRPGNMPEPAGEAEDLPQITSRYRRIAGASLIEVRLASLDQLFNTLDPSPFHQKDLDSDAEDYIVGAARELPMREPLRLVLHIGDARSASPDVADVAKWIQGYFGYRRQATARDLRYLFRQGRISLAIGLGFLASCHLLRGFLLGSVNPLLQLIAESLLIAGWVAMWRPLDIILYDWWPLRRMGKVYEKLAHIPVEIVRTDASR